MPRITITLSTEQHELYKSLSKYTGKPMSSILVELLDTARPVIERTAAVFQRIHEQQQIDRLRFTNDLKQAHDALEPLASNFLTQYDMFLNRVVENSDKKDVLEERTAASFNEPLPASFSSSATVSTPYTNRGDTPHPKKATKPLRNKASSVVKNSKKNKISTELKP